jgi:hypothetical protein
MSCKSIPPLLRLSIARIYQGTAVGVVLLGCAHRSGETMAGDITRHFDGTAVMAGIKMGPSWERWRLVAVCKDFCLL